MIIVEGFDCSGKSVIARRIADAIGWPVVHTGGPTKNEADVIACLERSRDRMTRRNVQDRITHVSESCYSMLSAPAKAALAIRSLRDFHAGVTVIYCRPPTEFLLEAVKLHHDEAWDTPVHMDRVLREGAQIIAIYDTVMEIVGAYTPIYKYDRSISGADEQIVDIMARRFRD